MTRRARKRPTTRTVVIDWTPALGEMFGRLPNAFGLTPPARAKVQFRGDRSTWSARYTDDAGQPVTAILRLKRLPDGDYDVLGESLNLRFSATAEQLRGEA